MFEVQGFCCKCGTKVPKGDAFCTKCGTKLNTLDKVTAPDPKSNNTIIDYTVPKVKPKESSFGRNLLYGIVGIIGIFFVLAIIGAMLPPSSHSTSASIAPSSVTPVLNKEVSASPPDSSKYQDKEVSAPPPDSSKYQDEEWINSVFKHSPTIIGDLDQIPNAFKTNKNKSDIIRMYSESLTMDANYALEESKSYSVSPKLQPAKDKYESALNEYSQAGHYYTLGASCYKNGQNSQAEQYFTTGSSYMASGAQDYQDAANITSSKDTTKISTTTNTGDIVYASSESNKFHSANCRYVAKIKPEHLITFNSRQEAGAAGYKACKVCGG